MQYRIDRYVQNENDPLQQVGYTDWIGGPTVANVRGAIISGTAERRAARVTGDPDTWFSIPAEIKYNGRRVTGWLGCDDGVYVFHPHLGE
jgi:hypothetical protein